MKPETLTFTEATDALRSGPVFSLEEVAERFQVTPATISRWRRASGAAGSIPSPEGWQGIVAEIASEAAERHLRFAAGLGELAARLRADVTD